MDALTDLRGKHLQCFWAGPGIKAPIDLPGDSTTDGKCVLWVQLDTHGNILVIEVIIEGCVVKVVTNTHTKFSVKFGIDMFEVRRM